VLLTEQTFLVGLTLGPEVGSITLLMLRLPVIRCAGHPRCRSEAIVS
jgi:hypothetical protein